LERAAEAVQDDVRQGYVTLAAARDYYGVVLDPETLDVDTRATEAERASLGPVHRRRVESQTAPARRLTAAQLSEKARDHPPVACLRISCCGMVSFPFLDDDEQRG
jgi:hypothetical protein